jgi:DNA-binding CsgD family transcriptional regulator
MNTEGLPHEFEYEGTAQGFVDYLWQLTQNQNAKFQVQLIPWKETYPYPDIYHRRDGTPIFVEYTVSRTIPITDPADGQKREASEYLPGVSFELNPLRGGNTNVIARCHNQVLEAWYFHVLEQFGVNPLEPSREVKGINTEKLQDVSDTRNDKLTRRQREVADLLARGMNDDEMAHVLFINKQTVKVHRRNIKEVWGMSHQHIHEMQVEARKRGYGKGI